MQDSIDTHLKEQGIPFGKYRLIAKLAIGGMAELFVAKQKGMGGFSKTVAVKCILPYFARDREFISMFLDEARLAAHLNHPNVVQIQDIGDVDGVFYMVMEYIAGQNLKAFAKRLYSDESYRKNPPFAVIASIMTQALQGLEHVHQAKDDNQVALQLVHRDISPNNLMLSYDGNVKVVDFGVAKAKTQERETAVGVLKGRLSYMSPEHLSGQALDGRSDLFAIGVVLYELTTNRRLFKRKTEAETMQALMTAPIPPPSRFYEQYPPGLEAILMKSLQRDPNKRFQTAGEMRDALEDWVLSLEQPIVGKRPVIKMMDTLFSEEKGLEAQGVYAQPVTQDDLLNLARGSYRVMPDGSIYSYFAAPGPQARLSDGTGVSPQRATMPPQTPPPHMHPPAHGGTSAYAMHHDDERTQAAQAAGPWHGASPPTEVELPGMDEEPTSVSSSHNELPGQSEVAVQVFDADALPDAKQDSSRRQPLETASYSVASEEALSSAGLNLEVGSLRPEQLRRSGHTKPMGSFSRGTVSDESSVESHELVAELEEKNGSQQAVHQDEPHSSGAKNVAHSVQAITPSELHVHSNAKRSKSKNMIVFILLFLGLLAGVGFWSWTEYTQSTHDTGDSKQAVASTDQTDSDDALNDAGQPPEYANPKESEPPKVLPENKQVIEPPKWRLSVRKSVPRRIVRKRKRVRKRRMVRKRKRVRKRRIRRSARRRAPVRRRRRLPTGPLRAQKSFSSVNLARKVRLKVYERSGGQRRYTKEHARLCYKIEREVGTLFGHPRAVRGITRAWQRYVKQRFARSRRMRFVFYPRAAAYVIFRDLSKGKSRGYVSQNLVKYQKRYRFSRYRNK